MPPVPSCIGQENCAAEFRRSKGDRDKYFFSQSPYSSRVAGHSLDAVDATSFEGARESRCTDFRIHLAAPGWPRPPRRPRKTCRRASSPSFPTAATARSRMKSGRNCYRSWKKVGRTLGPNRNTASAIFSNLLDQRKRKRVAEAAAEILNRAAIQFGNICSHATPPKRRRTEQPISNRCPAARIRSQPAGDRHPVAGDEGGGGPRRNRAATETARVSRASAATTCWRDRVHGRRARSPSGEAARTGTAGISD